MFLSVHTNSYKKRSKCVQYRLIDKISGHEIKNVFFADTKKGVYGVHQTDGDGNILIHQNGKETLKKICSGKIAFIRKEKLNNGNDSAGN